MAENNVSVAEDSEFALKCRMALEKSWGVSIPTPKGLKSCR
ncbi:MAG: hypothetical protein NWE96_12230 [Candidatus Bathyarchaeota archaeon]|nr:hypothetical protein [Candidatus Bathyarchaeota archaeon]